MSDKTDRMKADDTPSRASRGTTHVHAKDFQSVNFCTGMSEGWAKRPITEHSICVFFAHLACVHPRDQGSA